MDVHRQASHNEQAMDYQLLALTGLIVVAMIISTRLHSRSWPGRPGWQYQRVLSCGLFGLLLFLAGLVGWDLRHSRGWLQGANWGDRPVWWQVGLGAGLPLLASYWGRRVPPRLANTATQRSR